MSFNVTFNARSHYDAHQKLQQAFAPASVKALIEKAIDAIPVPTQPPPALELKAGASISGPMTIQSHSTEAPSSHGPKLLAIQVESYGHIADASSSLRSEIGRFVVQPIYG